MLKVSGVEYSFGPTTQRRFHSLRKKEGEPPPPPLSFPGSLAPCFSLLAEFFEKRGDPKEAS